MRLLFARWCLSVVSALAGVIRKKKEARVVLWKNRPMKSIESSKRMYPPLSVKDFHHISKQSGIPLTALESIYGKCSIDDEKHRVLIRLKGKIVD